VSAWGDDDVRVRRIGGQLTEGHLHVACVAILLRRRAPRRGAAESAVESVRSRFLIREWRCVFCSALACEGGAEWGPEELPRLVSDPDSSAEMDPAGQDEKIAQCKSDRSRDACAGRP